MLSSPRSELEAVSDGSKGCGGNSVIEPHSWEKGGAVNNVYDVSAEQIHGRD